MVGFSYEEDGERKIVMAAGRVFSAEDVAKVTAEKELAGWDSHMDAYSFDE